MQWNLVDSIGTQACSNHDDWRNLHDRIAHAIQQAQRDGLKHCGFFIDLDGFKSINDTLGHEAGDRVLCEVAQRLRNAVRESDTVARLGGDEFFVVAHQIGGEQEAFQVARKMLAAIAAPIEGVPRDLSLSASIGLCIFPYAGMSIADLLRRADQAMYQAKLAGKGDFVLAGDGCRDPVQRSGEAP